MPVSNILRLNVAKYNTYIAIDFRLFVVRDSGILLNMRSEAFAIKIFLQCSSKQNSKSTPAETK
jgi:hypothetical protein